MPNKPKSVIVDKAALFDALLRDSFAFFLRKTFETVTPGDTYYHSSSIDAIIYRLLKVHRGDCKRLIVSLPPRSLKSIMISIAYIAWALGHNPKLRFCCVSYSADLAGSLAQQFRLVIHSDWYRKAFPGVKWIRDTEFECTTSEGGGRFAVSTGGSLTGRGADTIVIDDPLNSNEVTDIALKGVWDWFRGTLISRLDDPIHGAIIVVAQRLHEDDLTGNLLRQGDWDHLMLPAIAEEDEEIPIGRSSFFIRKRGEVLDPVRVPLKKLLERRSLMGSIKFSAIYQQSPTPREGNLIKKSWIKTFDSLPDATTGQTIQSWDLATTIESHSDWSVCSTWLISMRYYYLLDVWRDRVEFPVLRRKLVELAMKYSPSQILVERAGAGLHLIQDLRFNRTPGVPLPVGITPQGDKHQRMAAQAARFEAGQVFFPRDAPWLGDLLHELLGFPHSRHDDQVDSVSQFLNWAERRHGEVVVPDMVFGPKIITD
jgi:predicted phage terminase large subunit-like protein